MQDGDADAAEVLLVQLQGPSARTLARPSMNSASPDTGQPFISSVVTVRTVVGVPTTTASIRPGANGRAARTPLSASAG